MEQNDKAILSSILRWINDRKTVSADIDSVDMALQCLGDAFAVPETEWAAATPLTELLGQNTSTASAEDPKFVEFIKTLEARGFFGGAAQGSAEYNARFEKARERFQAKVVSGPHSPFPSMCDSYQGSMSAPAPAAAAAAPDIDSAGDALKDQGNDAMKVGDYDRAIGLYSQAIQTCPSGKNSHIYFSNRAAAYSKVRNWEKAAADGQSAVDLEPSFVRGHQRLATALYYGGRYAEAVTAYERLLELDPANDDARDALVDARRRAAPTTSAPAAPGPGAGMGGLGSMLGGMDLGSLMNNPMVQSMMNNPEFMQNAMSMMQNPDMMQAVSGMFGGAGGAPGAAPGAAPSNPMAGMDLSGAADRLEAEHPELAHVAETMRTEGVAGMARHMGDPAVQAVMQAEMSRFSGGNNNTGGSSDSSDLPPADQ